MNYFYATRRDKNGNKLVTSYGKQEQAKKYGGADAKITKGLFYLDPEKGTVTEENTGLVMRSKLEGEKSADALSGNFVLYRQKGTEFVPTTYRYPTYGVANNAMKSLVSVLGTLVVVEEVGEEAEPETQEEELDSGVPF